MPTQAPNSRRPVNETADWTSRFRTASAWRTVKVMPFTMTLGALLLLTPLSQRSEAQQEVQSVSAPRLSPLPAAQVHSDPVVSEPETVPTEIVSTPNSAVETSSQLVVSSPSPSSSSSQHTPTTIDSSDAPAVSVGVEGATKKASAPVTPRSAIQPAEAAKPTFQIRVVADGKEQTAKVAVSPKLTVGQALVAMGISVAALDRVMPETTALARNGMSVRVTRIRNHIEKKREIIPAEVRYQPTTAITAGAKQVIAQPRSGYYETSTRVWTRDGKTTKREFVSRRLARQPQHKVIALGVKSNLMPNMIRPHRRYALAARGGSPRDRMMGAQAPQLAPANPNQFRAIKSLRVETTGYSAGPAGGAISNWTATGVRCTYGAVAVDPRLIPLGTKMYIEGYGYAFACDTGGAIKGHHIDLAFDSPRAAFRHGRRHSTVWILAP